MRTYKYKIQRHKRNRHLLKELRITSQVYNHFVALSKRHYHIYGQCNGYKPLRFVRMSRHLTKLKRLPKFAHWQVPNSWSVQNALKRLDFAYARLFKKLAK